MEKTIEETLKNKGGETIDFHISDQERQRLIDILGCVSHVLKTGKLYFNEPGAEINKDCAEFCLEIARRFANMPVHLEN